MKMRQISIERCSGGIETVCVRVVVRPCVLVCILISVNFTAELTQLSVC